MSETVDIETDYYRLHDENEQLRALVLGYRKAAMAWFGGNFNGIEELADEEREEGRAVSGYYTRLVELEKQAKALGVEVKE